MSSRAVPPPGWYPDPAGTSGRAYWNGREWAYPPPKSPTDKRTWVIVASILGVLFMLILIGNASGNEHDQAPVASTVTKTVTKTAQPPTVTLTPPPSIVTITQAAPPPALVESPASDAAPPPTFFESPASPPVDVASPPSTSAYYSDCGDARAAPLLVGEPGYRSGLDRDGDGIACES